MNFEWDENKNDINIKKHGIDFNDVIDMFYKPMLIESDDRFDYEEERYIGIGLLNSFIAFVVFVEKIDKNSVRIISARKANKYETRLFKKFIKNRLE